MGEMDYEVCIQYRVIFNGNHRRNLCLGEGLGGDPSSPYLFIIVAAVLNKLIKKAICHDLIF